MALIRAMNAGVSGLRSFQTKMDVIGNNIANVETAGFKSSRVSFAELMSQNIGRSDSGGDSSPQMDNQVGLGVRIASIDRDFTQGVMTNTGRTTDLAIEGEGYFMVKGESESFMTRAGNFVFNKHGQLVDQGGRAVQGYNAEEGSGVRSGGSLENIEIDFEKVLEPSQTREVNLGGNFAGEEGDIRTVSTTIYDSLGNAHSLIVEFEKMENGEDNEWGYEVKFPDSEEAPDNVSGTVKFDSDGNLIEDGASDTEIEVQGFDPESGAGEMDFTINFGSGDHGSGITHYAGSNTAKVLSQDGHAEGQLLDIEIDGEGRIRGIYDNGQNQAEAQIAIAQVQNENGLEMLGGGLFRTTSAAGEQFISTAEDIAGTLINSGSLEGSNVDLANEFTEMITSQRAYQSNARVISTSDEMLMEAVNLKR